MQSSIPQTRRSFVISSFATGFGSQLLLPLARSQILSGNQFLSNNPIKVENISITGALNINGPLFLDGIRVPAFSPKWFAVNIGVGVLQNIGGALIGGFLSAIFGGKSMEELFAEYLQNTAIIVEEIVDAKLKEEALRHARVSLAAIKGNMREYENAPKALTRLDHATDNSQLLVQDTKSLEFVGYMTFLSAAGMRLLILQERAKLDRDEVKNFEKAKTDYIAYHKSVDDKIAEELTPQAQVERIIRERAHHGQGDFFMMTRGGIGSAYESWRKDPSTAVVPTRIYGVPQTAYPLNPNCPAVDSFLRDFSRSLNMNEQQALRLTSRERIAKTIWQDKKSLQLIDWKALQEMVRQDTTSVGEKVATIWKHASC